MIHVCVLLHTGGFASTALAPAEIFRSAGYRWTGKSWRAQKRYFRTTTASYGGAPARSIGPVEITPAKSIDEVRDVDLIMVPSLGLDPNIERSMPDRRALVDWLVGWHDKGAAVAGVCSGVALLAEAGLLDGRRATTHWAMADLYRARYPKVDWQTELFVTEDADIYCGGGFNSATDLSLYLVEKYYGREVALETAKLLLIHMPRTWQSGFAALPLYAEHEDDKVTQAQAWLHEHWAEDVRLDELAAHLGMSTRNFIRRFKNATRVAPLAYLQKLRITAAKRLLEGRQKNVQEICYAVGYDDVPHFRTLFKRHTGTSPSDYRRQFGR